MNGEEMSFGIDDILVHTQRLLIIAEEEVEIFQRFAQKERFHHVSQFGFFGVFDGAQRAVSIFHAGILFESLKDLPAPFLISFITS